MKRCPKCNSEVDDNFDLCWNCQYSFIDDKILTNDDFQLVCPNCKAEVGPNKKFCPVCQFDLDTVPNENPEKPVGSKQINCLRCNVPLEFKGNYSFHEGTRVGALGDIFELFQNRESFDLYCCPKCGKVEFFLPMFD